MHCFADLSPVYVYLLGLYLGDGCIASHPRGVYRLRIVLDLKYPGIIKAAADAMRAMHDGKALVQRRPEKCVEVSSYWKHWPCLFPQHAPGRKHERRIVLTDWQQIVVRSSDQLLRGLIHSDGHRFINTGRNNWSCPRYGFTQVSTDIQGIFCNACDLLNLHWTKSGNQTIYVSRKADVERMDTFIGPKS